MFNVAHPHSEFADKGGFRDLHVEVNLGGVVMTIDHTAGDYCDGIATGYCGVDVKTVDIPVAPLQSITTSIKTYCHSFIAATT